MAWSREEIEEAFAHYQAVAADAGRTGDWNDWAELFTEDATYVEHHFGTMHGREAIRQWIAQTMAEWPNSEMTEFPVEWHIVDEERGWIACCIQNRMRDPGDGSVHQEANLTLLKYAGNGLWSYEEDAYNPANFGRMVAGWIETERRAGAG